MSNQEVPVKEQAPGVLAEGTPAGEEQRSQKYAQPMTPLPTTPSWPVPSSFGGSSLYPPSPWTGSASGPWRQWTSGGPSTPFFSPAARRRPIWPWIVLISVLLVLFISGGAFFLAGSLGYRLVSTASTTRHYTMSAFPTVALSDDTGSIHVRAGTSANDVTVTATRHVGWWGAADDASVTYTQDITSNTLTVRVGRTGSILPFAASGVDFTLIVPGTAVLQLKTNTGSIDVSGVSGSLVLTSNTGSVHASGGTLSSDSQLRTNTGSVTFTGAIRATGTYRFQTNTGSVRVTLPGASVFHVDASTDTGAIHTTFPAVVVVRHQFTGAEAHSDVGVAPRATIILTTNTGSLELYRQ